MILDLLVRFKDGSTKTEKDVNSAGFKDDTLVVNPDSGERSIEGALSFKYIGRAHV